MSAKKWFSAYMMTTMFLVIFITAVSATARVGERRDVKAIGEKAVRDGIITAPPKERDFTKIQPGASYEPGQLLVRFVPKAEGKSPSIAEKNQILSSLGDPVLKRNYDLVPGLTLIKLPANQTVEQALKTFNQTSGIMYAEPDYKMKVDVEPTDYFYYELWGLRQIKAPEAWDVSAGGNVDVVVAVIDTGIMAAHGDLFNNIWINEAEQNGVDGEDDDDWGFYVDDMAGWNFIGFSFGNAMDDPMDDHPRRHGTHVSGIVGASSNNNMGVTAVCWKVKIMPLKAFDDEGLGGVSDIVLAINYAVGMGADIINASWGGLPYVSCLGDAIGAAGILFVASAGNFKIDNDITPHYPSSYGHDNIISVLATDQSDELWDHNSILGSNYGATSVDIGAPGKDIYSCGWAEGQGAYTYYNLTGTSMAAPYVTGACALLMSVNPNLSHLEIKDIILTNVDELDSLKNPDRCVSKGRLNIDKAIRDPLVNAGWLLIDTPFITGTPWPTTEIPVTFNASGIALGTYNKNIVIDFEYPSSEDVLFDSPVIVPAQLTVTPPP